jgi:hypothetical protein
MSRRPASGPGAVRPGARGAWLALTLFGLSACRTSTPSITELRRALEAGEAARARLDPAAPLQREIAFAGPPVAHASPRRREQLAFLVELLAPQLLTSADVALSQSGESAPALGASLDPQAAEQPSVAMPAVPALTTPAETTAATAEINPGQATALGVNQTSSDNAAAGPSVSAAASALRVTELGPGRLLAIGPPGGRRILLRAAAGQRAELEPRLESHMQALAAALEELPAGPLRFEVALYLGPVDQQARSALGPGACSAEFVLALGAGARVPGGVPLLVRGLDPGAESPLPPDSSLSGRFFEAARSASAMEPGVSLLAPLVGDSSGAALWLRQSWMDLMDLLGPLPSGELGIDPRLCFGPSLVTAAPTVGLCFGPHGELADFDAVEQDPKRLEDSGLIALFAAALSLADPEPADFKRAIDSLGAERDLRVEAAAAVQGGRLGPVWLTHIEGARSWLRRSCFDLPEDDARRVLLALPEAESAQLP